MLEPDWLALNGYRVLGVSVGAGPKEVHAAAASLRRMASLGLQKPLQTDRNGLEVVARTEVEIRAAVGRLENPAQRLQDRLFWFTSDAADGQSQADLASDDGLRAHDTALHQLIAAARAGVGDDAVTLWGDALRSWSVVLQADAFWDRFQRIEINADFEPVALPSEYDGLRERAMSLSGAPLVSLGRTALAASDTALAGRVASGLDHLADTGAWATAAVGELLEPTLGPFLTCCADIEAEVENRVIREPGAAGRNAEPCAAWLRRYRNEVTPGLGLLRSLAPPDSDSLLRARDATAQCLVSIAAATTWADDYITADQLYREASTLANGTLAAFGIEEALEGIQRAVQQQRLRAARPKESARGPEEAWHPRTDGREALLASFVALCDRVGSELEGKLKRDAGAASQNKGPCSLALKRFKTEVTPALEKLLATVPEKNETHLRAREASARCLAAIASATTWTDDFIYAEKLYNDALALAEGTMATGMITNALSRISESANQQRLRGKPIAAAPALFTFNGIGSKLYGRSDPDAKTGSYVATLYFVIFMLPIFPLARYRVIEHPGSRYQFLGKQPFRPFDRWWLGLSVGAVVLATLWLTFQGQTPQSGTYAGASNPAVESAASPSAEVAGGSAPEPDTGVAGATPPAAPSTAIDGSGSGLKSSIESGRTRIQEIAEQLTDLKSQIDAADATLESRKSEIDELKSQQSLGQEIDVSEYNSKVDDYNDLIAKRRDIQTQYNDLVEEHNNLLAADRDMVAKYNSGER